MIILGIDGGGTKTHALVVDEYGTVLSSAVGGPSGYHTIGLNRALDELLAVTQHALKGSQPDVAVLCLGDCDTPTDKARLLAGLDALPLGERTLLYNDSFAALRAGSSRPYGAAVICGTGFNACGIAPDGRQAKLAALGALTGDWGGGSVLGTAAFGAAFRAEDGRGEPTILTSMLLKTIGARDMNVLTDWVADGKISHSQLSILAVLVFEAAEAGDRVAQSIVIHQADEIATTALAMLRRLDMCEIDVDVVLAGGVMHGRGPLLMDTIRTRVAAACSKANVLRLSVPPVVGSVFLAFDALNIAPPSIHTLKLPPETLVASLPN